MESFLTFIQSVGFPIFVACYLLYAQEKTNLEHKAEIDKMSEALNNNTLALERVLEHIRKEDEGG